jgi:adenylosuccinate lyase
VIARYRLPEMAAHFGEEARLATWLAVELAACRAGEGAGLVPPGTAERIAARVRLDARRAAEIEAAVHHDVIAFLSMVAESAGDDARHLHRGLTSSDLVDSALGVTVREAGAVLVAEMEALTEAVLALAERHRKTVCVGRTHGVHAEPTTFGLRALSWACELARAREGVRAGVARAATGKLSGSVGNFAHLSPAVEAAFCAALGLAPEPVATQVVARDRLAALLGSFAVFGGTVERVALAIRLGQRTECGELFEPFAAGQKGSSSMPHKRNPILCERLVGMSRLLRAYALAGYENQALWEERDIAHSSVERVALADAFHVAFYLARTLRRVVEGLEVRAERMRANLEATRGLVHSQRVLLALVEAGMARDEAYRRVQGHALATADGGDDFRRRLEGDPAIREVLGEKLAGCFDPAPLARHWDELFARAVGAARSGGELHAVAQGAR